MFSRIIKNSEIVAGMTLKEDVFRNYLIKNAEIW